MFTFDCHYNLQLFLPTCREAVTGKPKETDVQSPVSEAQTDVSDADQKNTNAIPLPSLTPLASTTNPPKPAPRTIMSAEMVRIQMTTVWTRNCFAPP